MRPRSIPRRLLVLLATAIALAGPVQAGKLLHVDGLGSLDFPTSSASAPARAAFLRGMLLLHVFEYSDAELAFQQAEALDPGFALAYWGEALCATHPVWNQQDVARGRAALAKLGDTPAAPAARAPTAREKAWLQTAELLYGDGAKLARDTQVERAFAQLSDAWPDDDEAKLFHSLWLLALGQGQRQDGPYAQAAAIARAVYRRNPDHPGAAHYWIHGMDDPAHAAGALEAAGTLARIAPDAGHAQHMTAHIFMALGRWDDVVAANVNAGRVVAAQYTAKGWPAYGCGHYAEWLEYAYFQQGREAEGMRVFRECLRTAAPAVAWAQAHPDRPIGIAKTPAAFKARVDASTVLMRATAMTESAAHRPEAAAADVDLGDVGALRGLAAFTRGLQRLDDADPVQAQRHLAALRLARDEALASVDAEPAERAQLGVMHDMLAGAIAAARGEQAGAARLLDAADVAWDALPVEFGPPATAKPPHELHGDILLAAGQPKAALAQYQLSLAAAPGRRLSLRGRARALQALGNPAAAGAWASLSTVLSRADPGLPDALEARAATR